MEIILYSILFFTGASIVSFLTVMAYEIPNSNVFCLRRSCCDNCKRQLSWNHTIPILGYLMTFGKCIWCHYKIPILYPVSELLGGLFLLAILPLEKDIYFVIPIFVMLILFSFMDIFHGYILPVYYLLVVPCFLLHTHTLFVIAGLAVWGTLYLLEYFGFGIGLGDVEVITLLTFLLGFEKILLIVILACLLCLLTFLLKKKKII